MEKLPITSIEPLNNGGILLEKFFLKSETLERIRKSWLGPQIESYVEWLVQNGYSPRNIYRRVPVLRQFGEFARKNGTKHLNTLPKSINGFIINWVRTHVSIKKGSKTQARDVRTNVNHFLRYILPGYIPENQKPKVEQPFKELAPKFFSYLREDRGNSKWTIVQYEVHLRRFEKYLKKIKLNNLSAISPTILCAFIIHSSKVMMKTSMRGLCSNLRIFLQYLYNEDITRQDLSGIIEPPRNYRLSGIPRSISWEDVKLVLERVDRRTPLGKRDYAMLLLMVTYGLRSREVAALKLDHVDWERDRLLIHNRKAGFNTAYPLSAIVGEAIVEYLKQGRPKTEDRHIFFRAIAPQVPLTHAIVSSRAGHYLKKAGINVKRPGSHTFRHTCVQRLLDADFSFKVIGDYIAHSSPETTKIYSKVAIESLREVAQTHEENWL